MANNIEDYEVEIIYNSSHANTESQYFARIKGWTTMGGLGATKEEALRYLYKNFEFYRSSGKVMPNPGSAPPISFASTKEILQYSDILLDFKFKILGFDKNESVFLSDESSLWDFTDGDNIQFFLDLIDQEFDVKIDPDQDLRIVTILDIIQKR